MYREFGRLERYSSCSLESTHDKILPVMTADEAPLTRNWYRLSYVRGELKRLVERFQRRWTIARALLC